MESESFENSFYYIEHSKNVYLEDYQNSNNIKVTELTYFNSINQNKDRDDNEPDEKINFWIQNSLAQSSINDPISHFEIKLIILSKLLQIYSLMNIFFHSFYISKYIDYKPLIILSFLDVVGGFAIRMFNSKFSICYAVISILYIVILLFHIGWLCQLSSAEFIYYFIVYLYINSDCCFDSYTSYDQTIIEEAIDCTDLLSNCKLRDDIESISWFLRKDSLGSFMKSDIRNCFIINDVFFIILKAFHIKLIFSFVNSLRSLEKSDLKRIMLNSKRVPLFS